MEVMYPRCSGLDVHKQFLIACVMYAQADGKLKQERKRFETTTNELRALVAWLQSFGITHVVMESTGVYWKPVYNLLHPHFTTWVVNASHLAQVPGRKTDDTDAQWLTKLMRYGLLQPSFIPEVEQRDLRELTRYRTRLLQEKSAALNRIQKVLEDANVKLAAVVSDIQGVSARLMVDALIANTLDTIQTAELAKGQLRSKIPQLVEALTGQVRPHHRFLLAEVLTHLDELNERITTLNQRIRTLVLPHEALIERLDAITGVGCTTAEIVLAEVGTSVDSWPTDRHLMSWACICPGNDESGGKRRSGRRRKGQKWLVPALIESAWAASHTKNTYLGAQFQRLRARRGAKRAAVAVAHSILQIIYHLLKDPTAVFTDLGGDYFLTKNKEYEQRRALKTLESLGFAVQLTPATA